MAVSGLRAFCNHFVSIESYYKPVMSFFSTYISASLPLCSNILHKYFKYIADISNFLTSYKDTIMMDLNVY